MESQHDLSLAEPMMTSVCKRHFPTIDLLDMELHTYGGNHTAIRLRETSEASDLWLTSDEIKSNSGMLVQCLSPKFENNSFGDAKSFLYREDFWNDFLLALWTYPA